jgi:hypothetical protein
MRVYRARYRRRHRRRHARERETRRMDYRLRAERAGKPVTRRTSRPVMDRSNGAYRHVTAEPLVPLLEARLADTPVTALGEVAQVDPCRIEAIVQGKAATLALGQADRLCVELGVPFSLLYGGTEI